MLRRIVGRAAALVTVLGLPAVSVAADGPFCGFFQPRGGAYYSPLHYWAPALQRVQFNTKGPACPGCPVSVCPPAWRGTVEVINPLVGVPAPVTGTPR